MLTIVVTSSIEGRLLRAAGRIAAAAIDELSLGAAVCNIG
jgi:hypothetical protein